MVNNIIGIAWMLMGFIGLIKPVYIHNFFKKKTHKRKFKLIVAAFLILGSFFLELFFSFHTIWLRAVVVIGFIVLVKGIIVVNEKVGEKITDCLAKVPIFYFRLIAIVFFVTGFVFWKIL